MSSKDKKVRSISNTKIDFRSSFLTFYEKERDIQNALIVAPKLSVPEVKPPKI